MMRFLYESHPPPARLRQQAPGETASTGDEDTPAVAIETALPASRVDLGQSLNWIFLRAARYRQDVVRPA